MSIRFFGVAHGTYLFGKALRMHRLINKTCTHTHIYTHICILIHVCVKLCVSVSVLVFFFVFVCQCVSLQTRGIQHTTSCHCEYSHDYHDDCDSCDNDCYADGADNLEKGISDVGYDDNGRVH